MRYLLVLCLAGCSTGVVPTGPSSYMVAAKSLALGANSGDAKANAFREANAFCQKQGQYFIPTSGTDRPPGFGHAPEAEVHFICVDKTDPRYSDPNLRPAANVTVEVKK